MCVCATFRTDWVVVCECVKGDEGEEEGEEKEPAEEEEADGIGVRIEACSFLFLFLSLFPSAFLPFLFSVSFLLVLLGVSVWAGISV